VIHAHSTANSTPLACDSCGLLPHPRKARLALAKLTAVFPLELVLHGVIIYFHPPYFVSVALLTISTTIFVIWVAEPTAMKLLGAWLHAPALDARARLYASGSLWRIRATIPDRPGTLEMLAHALAVRDVNILSVHVHPLSGEALDEFIVTAPHDLTPDVLRHTVGEAGGSSVQVWPTTALALADGQTKALTLAARITAHPDELPLALAQLLDAEVASKVLDEPAEDSESEGPPATALHVHVPGGDPLLLSRPGEPFTPAESARAHRLAELASLARDRERRHATVGRALDHVETDGEATSGA
jgi:hypothetical protein